MNRTTQERLYGWTAPRSLGIRGALTLLVLFPLVTCQVALTAMTLIWGPPAAAPLFPYASTRIVLLSTAAGAAPWLLRPSLRAPLLPLIAVLCLISSTPLFSPHHAFLAMVYAAGSPGLTGAVIACLGLGGLMGILVVRGIMTRTSEQLSLAKGSTQWGSAQALKKPAKGLLLGKTGADYLRYDGDGHLLTVAATRSGKGVGHIPRLISPGLPPPITGVRP